MHRDGVPIADGDKMMMRFFRNTPSLGLAHSSPDNDYSSIFFNSPTSDHQNSTATEDLSILMLKHKDLLNRHKTCLSHLEKTFKEAEILRQENTNLRVANRDLNNYLNLVLRAYLENSYVPMMPAGSNSSTADIAISSIHKKFGSLNIGEKNSGGARFDGFDSSMSVTGSEIDTVEKDENRVSLPKSISVRSDGFLKTSQATPTTIRVPPKPEANQNRPQFPVDAPQKVYVHGGNKENEAIELKVYNQGTSKTELCNKWQETGSCPYGDNCQFAHGIEELRPVLRHPRYKTQVCRMVLAGDNCPYGQRCHFRHALTDQEKSMALLKLD